MTSPREPIAADAPLPHRKVVRSWVAPMAVRTYARPVLLLLSLCQRGPPAPGRPRFRGVGRVAGAALP